MQHNRAHEPEYLSPHFKIDDVVEEEDGEGVAEPFQRRLGHRRSLNIGSLEINRPASAPPIEIQRLFTTILESEDEQIREDDPRRNPGYASFFHSNPRLPPPLYAPGQSWQQIWAQPTGRPSAVISSAVETIHEDGNEFDDLQRQIDNSSAESSSSSSSPKMNSLQHRKRLVDMIQEDFPRTPSPVYTRQGNGSGRSALGASTEFLTTNFEQFTIAEEPVVLPRPTTNPGIKFGRAVEQENRPLDLVEEIKQGGRRRPIELADVMGHLVRLSVDQHGSRFIQQKLEQTSPVDRDRVFGELLPCALDLMTDVFGNYVIQKFFEHGSAVQQETLCGLMKGHVLELALQMYGCRVVQKALEHGTALCRRMISAELEGSVLRCVKDQNGNHVIQKCIECIPKESAPFLSRAFTGQVYALATHPYGCRVIQRFFEHADPTYTRPLIDELLRFTENLVRDQYGNYVIQHLIERGRPTDRAAIISSIRGGILDLSRHKFASNVVEKCVEFGSPADRQAFLDEVLAATQHANEEDAFPLLLMMRDQYANYVVQKMLDLLSGSQRDTLLDRIRPHLTHLRKFTYGKHIIAKVDRLLQQQQQQQQQRVHL